ncbi:MULTISPECIES: hypothetical protein [Streptomyces]|uniref:hypothetical protein n=1 Tax=Streptomyces TaxID=1883 RepID=UPI00163D222F|nr:MULTISPECIES: hypothetical protein [Streptomyces]MBC2876469.1 hypothetical protein [Streptomyces sp. TYQ1024]UBI40857.1 hypothetical protein K7I03_33260 [Streptomyces mobaraensis]
MPLDDHDDALARRLSAALKNAAEACPPPSPGLVDRATARGRRLRRARFLQAGAGAATLTLVALGGTLLLDTGGAGGATPAEDVRPAAPRTARPSPTRVSGQEMVATLTSLLPKGGTVTGASGTGSGDAGQALTAKLTYTGAHGATALDIAIRRLNPGDRPDGCLPVQVRPYDRCEARELPGGGTLYTTRSFTRPTGDTGQRRWYAELVTKDGVSLLLQEFGGGEEKATESGADPALTLDQLGSIVRSPAWHKAVDALPPAGAPSSSGKPTASDGRLARVLLSLLPPGGRITDLHSDDALVQLVYDDGHGKSMIEVDVQDGMAEALDGHMTCPSDAGDDCRARPLPDGTRVKVTRTPSEKGGDAVVWTADTLRKDGRRVLVREINSFAESGPVTRSEPPLSLDRIRSMALDRKWIE